MEMPKTIFDLIRALVGSDEFANKWWVSPNTSFEGRSPQETYTHNTDTVLAYLAKHCSYFI